MPLIESIDDINLQDLGSIYQNYQQLDEMKYPDIKEAINMLEELKHISHNSKFKILGLFTIIEFLITHKPINKRDSITQQVTNKINLLSKRFSKKLDYSQFFLNTPESTVWKKLYAYRSNIAHGDQPDFAKDLLVLKDDFTAKKFLKLVVKMLLQHSLIEPQLYTDLK
ncbi:HEPN domain-containing protein [uncultured Nostoc sp.]|uniref:HEPN domain-containing protein n=1 Tax=uncultured Nostoc sp. TaxID=340711 RepID=UPI00261BF3C4|nr:HEPN domain-containing protein [uncultured Nostoc sp.]